MRILMVTASRHGSTDEIGQEIAASLAAAGFVVTVSEPGDVSAVTGYDAVVLGSAVYYGRWMAAMGEFVERLADQLRHARLWLYWSGPVARQRPHRGGAGSPEAYVRRLEPRGWREFGGKVDARTLGRGEKSILSMSGGGPGDFRDFDEVREFAQEIVADLAGPAA